MMDGEASEIEVHRLLRQMGSDDTLKDVWLSWHQVRGVIQSQDGQMQLRHDQHQILHSNISDAIRDEDAYEMVTPRKRPSLVKPAAGLAMAASLVVAVFVGMSLNQPQEAQVAAGTLTNRPAPVIEPTLVSNEGPQLDEDLKQLNEEDQRRLRAYLNQHDRVARMKSDTQMVTYPGQK